MLAFTVWGFVSEGGRFTDFHLDILAESPMDATERAQKQYASLVVSGVSRSESGRLFDY